MVTRLCLVGAGSIGRRHLRLLLERQDVTLCVVEPNEVCRAAVAQEHPQIHDLQIVGDKGYILGDFMSADVTVGSRETADTEVFPGTRDDFNNVYRTFLRAVRGERKAENPPRQAIVSTLLMHSRIESAESGKEVNIHAIAKKYGYHF